MKRPPAFCVVALVVISTPGCLTSFGTLVDASPEVMAVGEALDDAIFDAMFDAIVFGESRSELTPVRSNAGGGRVTASGKPVYGATVHLVVGDSVAADAMTNSVGTYRFDPMPVADQDCLRIEVRISHPDFATAPPLQTHCGTWRMEYDFVDGLVKAQYDALWH
jgi:hypothetical protein